MINTVGSRIYLEEGDIIKIKDLLYGLMLNSGNDASISLAIGLANTVISILIGYPIAYVLAKKEYKFRKLDVILGISSFYICI